MKKPFKSNIEHLELYNKNFYSLMANEFLNASKVIETIIVNNIVHVFCEIVKSKFKNDEENSQYDYSDGIVFYVDKKGRLLITVEAEYMEKLFNAEFGKPTDNGTVENHPNAAFRYAFAEINDRRLFELLSNESVKELESMNVNLNRYVRGQTSISRSDDKVEALFTITQR